MLTVTNSAAPLVFVGYNGTSVNYTSAQGFSLAVWCPTYRYQFTANVPEIRNSSSIYFRGFRDSMDFRTVDGVPWKHRRIVVGASLNVVDTMGVNTSNYQDTGRLWRMNQPSYYAFLEVIMRGTQGVDWVDPFTAKIDTNRVTVYHDKVYSATPATTSGAYKVRKFWHPVNKTITYDDEENGATNNSSPWARLESGNQNIYCLDILAGSSGAIAGNINFQSTSYWHER